MTQSRVTIIKREPEILPGYTSVHAMIENGVNGWYTVASSIVDTEQEITEILAQSADRGEVRRATRAGQD